MNGLMTRLQTPILIINTKNYLEVSGDKSISLAKAAEAVSHKIGVEIALAPPIPFIGQIARAVSIPILSQHIDADLPGASTGAVVPEIVKSSGAVGSIINHSEKRIYYSLLKETINRMNLVGLVSVVCVKTSEEASKVACLDVDFIAIEPPELIGSGVAVSKAEPEIVSRSVETVRRVNSAVKVICGAGIVTGDDVESALLLGSAGVLVASGVVKSEDWTKKIFELAEPLKSFSNKL